MGTRRLAIIVVALGTAALAACSGEVEGPDNPQVPVPTPSVSSLSTSAAAVGDAIEFSGSGFIDPEHGRTTVTFRGTYEHDGASEQINLTFDADFVNENTVRWSRFGPYQIPFSRSGNQLGTFRGEVFATNIANDGREERQPAETSAQASLEVLPSLVISEVTASGEGFEADCNFVGTRVVNWVPYRVTVEAVGFRANRIRYSVASGALDGEVASSEPVQITHESDLGSFTIDSLGELETLRFAGVPMGVPVYRSSIEVTAEAEDGSTYSQFLMLTVHEPLFIRYFTDLEPAEIMEPVPVSGCMAGGTNGRDVSYQETTSETRSMSTQQSWTSNWANSYTEQHTETYGEAGSEANKIGFSSADQNNWSWNINGSVMAGGEAGVPLVTKGKVEVRVGGGHDWGGSHTDTRSGEQAWTKTASYSEAMATTEQVMESLGEGFTESWTLTSQHSESLNYRAFLLPNHYGVFYRQTTRLVRRGHIIAMDLCGNETVVGEIITNDYTWAPDLAMSTESCPPFPQSSLPEQTCLIEPCDQ